MTANKLLLFLIFYLFIFTQVICQNDSAKHIILIHGGAGGITKKWINDELENQYTQALTRALEIGDSVLKNNGTALDAIQLTIQYMENSPLFNAGKGAVYNSKGKQEMDASIMNGKDLNCGSVGGVSNLKNPIEGARLVMDKSKHVFLTGKGAEEFCIEQGATIVDSSYFFDERRINQLKKEKEKNAIKSNHDSNGQLIDPNQEETYTKYGTVGAIAMDKNGNIAAATSTGGLTNKKYGRIGDSPIIGAGTYANNKTCAVSCTGTGEYFIRTSVAHNISALMLHAKMSLEEAGKTALDEMAAIGGDGGLIALDKDGNYIMLFNTSGMFRGVKKSGENAEVLMFGNEK